ncbi:MAG: hypothetical protein ACODAD_05160, partial [Planctomycetota bacterium]
TRRFGHGVRDGKSGAGNKRHTTHGLYGLLRAVTKRGIRFQTPLDDSPSVRFCYQGLPLQR